MIHRQFVVYVLIGVFSAAIDVALMQLLFVGGVNVGLAATVGFVAGLLFNYFSHQNITFRSRPSVGSMLKYGVVVLGNYLFTLGMVYGSVYLVDSALPGKILSLPLIAVNGFLLGKYWIFRSPAHAG